MLVCGKRVVVSTGVLVDVELFLFEGNKNVNSTRKKLEKKPKKNLLS